MGAYNSTARYRQNLANTPPSNNNRLLFDPRSPSDGITRSPIQIDCQVPTAPIKLYNNVMPYIIGPDINISEENNENSHYQQKINYEENEPKRTSGVEPTLDPTKVLTALVANHQGQLPPYQL